MATKNTIQIVIAVILAVIASALVIIVLEKAGVVSFAHAGHNHTSVQNNTVEFHKGEVEGHKHGADCGHKHDHDAKPHADHKHGADCKDKHDHDVKPHADHKHGVDCKDKHGHDAKPHTDHKH